MYRHTRFMQLMKVFPRTAFHQAVEQHQADKHSKGFRCYDQLIAMLFAQFTQSRSLRELTTRFHAYSNHHYHLGTRSIHRSTLADANAKRNPQVYADVLGQLLTQAKGRVKQELSQLMYLVDSSPINLYGAPFQWADATRTRCTRGLKLHVMMEASVHAPVHANITKTNVNDIDDARQMTLEQGVLYVFDKGYCSYQWWHEIDKKGSHFVTRFKSNAALVTHKKRDVTDMQDTIVADDLVTFKNRRPRGGALNPYTKPLRRISVAREGKKPMVLATNDIDSPAQTIAECYKKRWRIELFFKWIKQRLKLKSFLGTSENAIKIQIYTALIAYLLVWLLQRQQSQSKQNTTMFLWTIKSQLFQTMDTVYQRYKHRNIRHQDMLSRQGVLL